MSERIRTLIVDDEALARRGLELRLKSEPRFEIIAQCENAREALDAIRTHQPQIMFLDIQMPGQSGFELLMQVPPALLPIVVFVTAYDQYAMRAFEARAFDYLLKPIDDSRLKAILERIQAHLSARDAIRQRDRLFGLIGEITGCGELALEEVLEQGRAAIAPAHADILPIRQGRETVRVPTASIDWIDAAGDYMCIHASGQTHILRGTMKDLEDVLDPRLFQRVHRSTIVNLRRVKSLRAHINGEYFLTLEDGHDLKLSRSYRDKVEYLLKG